MLGAIASVLIVFATLVGKVFLIGTIGFFLDYISSIRPKYASLLRNSSKWMYNLLVLLNTFSYASDILRLFLSYASDNMKRLYELIKSIDLVECLLLVLILCIATYCCVRIIGTLSISRKKGNERVSTAHKQGLFAVSTAHKRWLRLSSCILDESVKKLYKSQGDLLYDWVLNMFFAGCFTRAACILRYLSGGKLSIWYFFFVIASVPLTINACKRCNQLNYIFLKRTVLVSLKHVGVLKILKYLLQYVGVLKILHCVGVVLKPEHRLTKKQRLAEKSKLKEENRHLQTLSLSQRVSDEFYGQRKIATFSQVTKRVGAFIKNMKKRSDDNAPDDSPAQDSQPSSPGDSPAPDSHPSSRPGVKVHTTSMDVCVEDQMFYSSSDDGSGDTSHGFPRNVDMVEAKTKHGGTKIVPKYAAGTEMYYKNAEEVLQKATILDVHLDDLFDPYYSIRLEDGKVVQTDNAHLTAIWGGLDDKKKTEEENTGPLVPSIVLFICMVGLVGYAITLVAGAYSLSITALVVIFSSSGFEVGPRPSSKASSQPSDSPSSEPNLTPNFSSTSSLGAPQSSSSVPSSSPSSNPSLSCQPSSQPSVNQPISSQRDVQFDLDSPSIGISRPPFQYTSTGMSPRNIQELVLYQTTLDFAQRINKKTSTKRRRGRSGKGNRKLSKSNSAVNTKELFLQGQRKMKRMTVERRAAPRRFIHWLTKGRPKMMVIFSLLFFIPGVSAVLDGSPVSINTLAGATATATAIATGIAVSRTEFDDEQLEAFQYAIDISADENLSEKEVVKELESKFGKSKWTYNRWIKLGTKTVPTQVTKTVDICTWKDEVIEGLLSRYEVDSDEWKKAVERISKSNFGPTVEEIHRIVKRAGPSSTSTVSSSTVSGFAGQSAVYHQQAELMQQSQFNFGCNPFYWQTSSLPMSQMHNPMNMPPTTFRMGNPSKPTSNNISPTNTVSSASFSDSDEDDSLLGTSLYSDGDLKPEVVESIISNLSKSQKLSKNEKKLYEALHMIQVEDCGADSNECSRVLRRERACRDLRPKSYQKDKETFGSGEDAACFSNEAKDESKATATKYDAQDLLAVLQTISHYNPVRAAKAIASVLRLDTKLFERVRKLAYNGVKSISEHIVDNIRKCLSHHTPSRGGTRPGPSENLVKNICLSVVWFLDQTKFSPTQICETLGSMNVRQIFTAIETAKQLRSSSTQVQYPTRAQRKDRIREKLWPFLMKFCNDDQITRLDTNHPPTEQLNPLSGEVESLATRIWLLPTWSERYYSFCESDYYEEFKVKYEATVGETVFREELKKCCKFVRDETQRSCVDNVISDLEHAMTALLKICNQEKVQNVLSSFVSNMNMISFQELVDALKRGRYSYIVRLLCCEEHSYTDVPKNEKGDTLKLTCFECAYGGCPNCGILEKLGGDEDGILNELENAKEAPATVEFMKWDNAPRQGSNEKGKQNTQLELTKKTMPLEDFLNHFKECLKKCTPHYHNIRWTNWVKNNDIHTLAENACCILTDFGATTNLKAIETLNCATDGHLVCLNAVVLSNRRLVKVKALKEDGEYEEYEKEIHTVEHHHFLTETLTKGKKADHVMHKHCLDKIIDIYKPRGIKNFIYWTDNAPHQYKCRQTFYTDASVAERHGEGINIIHRFAVVSQFKGPHDAAGKEIGRTIFKIEKKGQRCDDAWTSFINLNAEFERKRIERESPTWKELEDSQDERIENKGVYGMDSRTIYFVCETAEEMEEKKRQYPDLSHLILVCDRTQADSTQDAVRKTAEVHECCSLCHNTPSLPRQSKCQVADLMCCCVECSNNTDRVNNNCPYKKYTNPRLETLEANIPTKDEVQEFMNKCVIGTFRSGNKYSNKLGRVVDYSRVSIGGDENSLTWRFHVDFSHPDDVDDSNDVGYLDYHDVCWSMTRFNLYQDDQDDRAADEKLTAFDWSVANPHFIKCTHCNEAKMNATCDNKMCSECCPTHGVHDCSMKTHRKQSTILNLEKEKLLQELPNILQELPDVIPAVIKSYREDKPMPGVKYLRAILLFCYDETTKKGERKKFYVDKLDGAYEDDPEKLTDPEKLANALSNPSDLSST